MSTFTSIVDGNEFFGRKVKSPINEDGALRVINFYCSILGEIFDVKRNTRVTKSYMQLVFFNRCPSKNVVLELEFVCPPSGFPVDVDKMNETPKAVFLR